MLEDGSKTYQLKSKQEHEHLKLWGSELNFLSVLGENFDVLALSKVDKHKLTSLSANTQQSFLNLLT